MTEPVERYALFVSSVEGCAVTRFGTRTLIGATRSTLSPKVLTFETEKIIGISVAEYERFEREYERAIANKTLRKRKPAEWQQQQSKRAAEEKAARDAKEARRKEDQRGEGTPSAPDTPAQE